MARKNRHPGFWVVIISKTVKTASNCVLSRSALAPRRARVRRIIPCHRIGKVGVVLGLRRHIHYSDFLLASYSTPFEGDIDTSYTEKEEEEEEASNMFSIEY